MKKKLRYLRRARYIQHRVRYSIRIHRFCMRDLSCYVFWLLPALSHWSITILLSPTVCTQFSTIFIVLNNTNISYRTLKNIPNYIWIIEKIIRRLRSYTLKWLITLLSILSILQFHVFSQYILKRCYPCALVLNCSRLFMWVAPNLTNIFSIITSLYNHFNYKR